MKDLEIVLYDTLVVLPSQKRKTGRNKGEYMSIAGSGRRSHIMAIKDFNGRYGAITYYDSDLVGKSLKLSGTGFVTIFDEKRFNRIKNWILKKDINKVCLALLGVPSVLLSDQEFLSIYDAPTDKQNNMYRDIMSSAGRG